MSSRPPLCVPLLSFSEFSFQKRRFDHFVAAAAAADDDDDDGDIGNGGVCVGDGSSQHCS